MHVTEKLVVACVVLIVPSIAAAADLAPHPVEPAPPIVLPFSWTGFYAGFNTGLASGAGEGAYPDPRSFRFETAHPKAAGVLVGGQVGYNYQWNAIVFGAEGELDISGAEGDSPIETFPGGVNVGAHDENSVTYLGSVTARVGYALDAVLLYGKGGIGFARLAMQDVTDLSSAVNAKGSEEMVGWTLGAGVEYALNSHWTVRGDYQYYGFDAKVPLKGAVLPRVYDDNFGVQAVRIGVNYRF